MDEDLKQFGNTSKGDAVFDASQYAFFGNDAVVEEIELGGLEDEEDDVPSVGFDDQKLSIGREEVEVFNSFSDVEDLDATFSKLNSVVSGPRCTGIGDRASRESSLSTEWSQEGLKSWYGQQKEKEWSSHPHSSSPNFLESENLHRTSSYPEMHQQQYIIPQHFSSQPISVPKSSSFIPYPPPGNRSHQGSPNLNTPYYRTDGRPHVSLSSPNLPLSSNSYGSPYRGNMHQFNNRPSNQWALQGGLYSAENSNGVNNLLSPPNGIMSQNSNRLHHPTQQQYGNLSGMQAQLYNPRVSPVPPIINHFESVVRMGDMRDQRPRLIQQMRPNPYISQQGFDIVGRPQFRSKNMRADEIENIHRMQIAVTLSNDPYVDDYYHQACLAKKSYGSRLKFHFCPSSLHPQGRSNSEPPAYLQVEALGRVPFASVRRPRPLLEVDPLNSFSSKSSSDHNNTFSENTLEKDPIITARVIIEDGFCILLTVDDIDRFLQFNQFQDNGTQLIQKRQTLLEKIATSLKLGKDNMVLLRVISLPKGRKLFSRYLPLLSPNSDLLHIICTAIFRHLRFLFDGLSYDPILAKTTTNLANCVSSCVQRMDLRTLSTCLSAVACSSEQPPLRPLGSPAGDGATIILKSVLERATNLSTDPHISGNFNMAHQAMWQASFGDFFGILTKYCKMKYDNIIGSDAVSAISKEMPVDLLRASLPHMNEQQRRVLLEFAQRSMPADTGV